jgi:hypothetical protein
MNETITIDKETAQLLADFVMKHGYDWRKFYNEQKGRWEVWTPESHQAWRRVIDLLRGPAPKKEEE